MAYALLVFQTTYLVLAALALLVVVLYGLVIIGTMIWVALE